MQLSACVLANEKLFHFRHVLELIFRGRKWNAVGKPVFGTVNYENWPQKFAKIQEILTFSATELLVARHQNQWIKYEKLHSIRWIDVDIASAVSMPLH